MPGIKKVTGAQRYVLTVGDQAVLMVLRCFPFQDAEGFSVDVSAGSVPGRGENGKSIQIDFIDLY